jgi:hypothetical protein
MLPKRMTEEEKELFIKIKSISSYNPRGNNWHLHNCLI